MRLCENCGEILPPRAKGGHREREYCSDRCRQRAYRADKKREREIERIIYQEEAYGLPDPSARRDEWRFERAGLLQACKLMESERNVALADAKVATGRMALLEDEVRILKDLLADAQAEIVRLNVLLEGQARKNR